MSRNRARALVDQGRVLIDGVVPKPSHKVRLGEKITWTLAVAEPAAGLLPEQGTLIILHEDDDLLAVDKPSGLLSHPNPASNTGSLLNLILGSGRTLQGGDDPLRAGLVHRLDRETSGVLILAKNIETYTYLQDQFKARLVTKEYICVVRGHIERLEFSCNLPLARDPRRRNARCVDPTGRSATTHFRCLEKLGAKYALLSARPLTGRTHQIRVHLQALGFAIVGDELYGVPLRGMKPGLEIDRMLLHSQRLSLKHPRSQETLDISADEPPNFVAAVERLRH